MEEDFWFAQNNIFSGLSPAEKRKLVKLGKQYTYNKDDYIFQARNPDKSIHLLIGGHAKVFHVSETGKEIILWFCLPGEIFGLAECLNGSHRKVYAQACSIASVISIPEQDFNHFLSTNNALAKELIGLLSNRLRILSKTLLSVSTDDAESKVKHIISRLFQCYGTLNNDVMKINFNITHQEIADMIGISRQTVTTVINQLKRQNLLYVSDHKIHLHYSRWLNASNTADINFSSQLVG